MLRTLSKIEAEEPCITAAENGACVERGRKVLAKGALGFGWSVHVGRRRKGPNKGRSSQEERRGNIRVESQIADIEKCKELIK